LSEKEIKHSIMVTIEEEANSYCKTYVAATKEEQTSKASLGN